jgi:hypothetical protein
LDWLAEHPLLRLEADTGPPPPGSDRIDSMSAERCWLPIVGPGAWVMARRLAWWAAEGVNAFTLYDLGAAIGLPGSTGGRNRPVARTLVRCVQFRLVAVTADGAGVAARGWVGAVPAAWQSRLPEVVRRDLDGDRARSPVEAPGRLTVSPGRVGAGRAASNSAG